MVGAADGGIRLDGIVHPFGIGEVLVEASIWLAQRLGLDAAKPALGPLGGDQGVSTSASCWVGWAMVEEECSGNAFRGRGPS
jgi:hypothetical protein